MPVIGKRNRLRKPPRLRYNALDDHLRQDIGLPPARRRPHMPYV
ncbi:hypothetical protein ACW9UR_13995 [Halovulum sp. GXIMD14794]